MLYERDYRSSSNLSFTFDFGKKYSNFDCHSFALSENENYLLLLGNHQLQLINFETFTTSLANLIHQDHSIIIPCSSDIHTIPLFDICNIHRPLVQWNQQEPKEYALAIDRLVRFYRIDHGRIEEINSLDSQHQRPISTICYWPQDPYCFLTGSLDGQVHMWDTRQCSSKTPAYLKSTISTPFNIRHIQWASSKSDNTELVNDSNQLAIQCDRCVRVYDIRRMDSYLCSIDHTQRVVSMDWTMQNHSIVTLSMDNSLRIFSTNGNLLAQSIPDEQLPFTLSKIRTTMYDSLFICTSRDPVASTYGYIGWRWDEDQYLRPLTDRIVSTSLSAINDFAFVTNARFCNLYNQILSSRSNNELFKHFPILTCSRDKQIRLIDMDCTFRQTWHDYSRAKMRKSSDLSTETIISKSSSSSLGNLSRQPFHRRNSNKLPMDVIEDEITDPGESDLDENRYPEPPSPRVSSIASPETADEVDSSICSGHTYHPPTEISIKTEFLCLLDTYGPYITVEMKDEQRRICIVRCIYPLDSSGSFRIYLVLSRHYPIISELFIRFKCPVTDDGEAIKKFQMRIQTLLGETSYKCFYYGRICLHTCLLKLKRFFHSFSKQEKSSMNIRTNQSNKKQREESLHHQSDMDSPTGMPHQPPPSSNRVFDFSLSSPRVNDSLSSNDPSIRASRRTCGARFAGGTYLICFGRTLNLQQPPSSAPPILSTINDRIINRPVPAHIRSISLTVTKSRGNSGTDDQSSSYRSTMTTRTSNVQIQHAPNNQRTTMFSAPVRSTFGSSIVSDHQRISTSTASLRRPLSHHQSIQPNSIISIYDLSILLPINKKLANDYKLDLDHLIHMCEINQKLTEQMAKYELAHCWRLLAGLLTLQPTLTEDHSWFQAPLAQGLIKHIVGHYIADGDIQSASMFLLTMSKTPFMKNRLKKEHYYDSVLYSYANLLHRWRHFYKRTQILQQIDHNCQLPAPINSISSTIICSICSQPVVGQHFLCPICGHGGHLSHMHRWFGSTEKKHRYCPEKDCHCRCVVKQQELLTINSDQIQKHQQQHTPILTPRAYALRPSSVSVRHS